MSELFEFMKATTRSHVQSFKKQEVKEILDLARTLRDAPYPYDRDGYLDRQNDLDVLCDKLSLLHMEIENGN